MPKNSQITVFVMIGLVFLVTMGIMLWKLGMIREQETALERERILDDDRFMESENIRFSECVRQLSYEAFRLLGESGLIYPEHYAGNVVPFAYYYYDGELAVPAIHDIEEQLEMYIRSNIDSCAYSPYAVYDKPDEAKVKASILPSKIVFGISYKARPKREVSLSSLKDVSIEIPYNFSRIYYSANEIAMMSKEDPGWIDSALLLDLPVNVTMSYIAADTIVYTLSDVYPKGVYDFSFAVKVGQ